MPSGFPYSNITRAGAASVAGWPVKYRDGHLQRAWAEGVLKL
jgi:hypothetical protein